VPWCRFFIPKIASPRVKPGDPDLNEHISYAKCIKGHVLRSSDDWIQCENLPSSDSKCWQEGGPTLFTLTVRQRNEAKEAQQQETQRQDEMEGQAPTKQTSKS
jgi:hypothetical protein